jgi:hypothetical protein
VGAENPIHDLYLDLRYGQALGEDGAVVLSFSMWRSFACFSCFGSAGMNKRNWPWKSSYSGTRWRCCANQTGMFCKHAVVECSRNALAGVDVTTVEESEVKGLSRHNDLIRARRWDFRYPHAVDDVGGRDESSLQMDTDLT